MRTDWLQVPLIQQLHDGDCLPACAAMVLRYWQDNRSLKQISRLFGTESFGTPPWRIQRLEKWGFIVDYRISTLENLADSLTRKVPPIAMVKTGFLEHWDEYDTGHAVVVVGIDDENVFLNDPAFPETPQITSIDGFAAAWIERDEMAAFIYPSKK